MKETFFCRKTDYIDYGENKHENFYREGSYVQKTACFESSTSFSLYRYGRLSKEQKAKHCLILREVFQENPSK